MLFPFLSVARSLRAAEIGGLKIKKIALTAGLEKPIKFLQISDVHYVFSDARDDGFTQELARKRFKSFRNADKYFTQAISYAKENGELAVITGDFYDFANPKTLEECKKKLDGTDYVFAVGNHEFSQYVGSRPEEANFRNKIYPEVQKVFKNSLEFSARVYGGVNFVCVDNSNYRFTLRQFEKLKAEIEKGMPTIVAFHIPIYTPALYDKYRKPGGGLVQMAGVPEKVSGAKTNISPDALTVEFAEYLKTCKNVVAVICGHKHAYGEDAFGCTREFVCGCAAKGEVCEFTLV